MPIRGTSGFEKLRDFCQAVKHLGKRLMETARQHAINAGCGGITLTTHFANIRGQALYKKCGYERLGTHSCGSEFLFLLRLPND